MSSSRRVAAVTGASGYLGSLICQRFQDRNWQVVRLVRDPAVTQEPAVAYDLATSVSDDVRRVLGRVDVLVHAAYDLTLTRPSDVWRVNVDGTRALLNAAADQGLSRIVVLSSMSAYEGTGQLYGRAKLDIEKMTVAGGGCAVRPGLVYGESPGGMVGSLRELDKLPVVPLIASSSLLYTIRDEDLTEAICSLAEATSLDPQVISLAHETPVRLESIMQALAARDGRKCRFVTIPWRLVYAILRTAEALRIRVPFRADSVIGLVRPAPGIAHPAVFGELGISIASFNVSGHRGLDD